MGEAQLDKENRSLIIHADLIFYGNAASEELSKMIAADIERHWNEPHASVHIHHEWYRVQFLITGTYA